MRILEADFRLTIVIPQIQHLTSMVWEGGGGVVKEYFLYACEYVDVGQPTPWRKRFQFILFTKKSTKLCVLRLWKLYVKEVRDHGTLFKNQREMRCR